MALVARQYSNICYNNAGQAYRCNSTWNNWARWVVLGIIIVAAFFLFFICSCISARRRRKLGRNPYYGTGWAHRPPGGAAQYNPNYPNQQQSNYNQPTGAGGYYGQNQSYGQTQSYGQNQGSYGNRGNDVEMQPPTNTYSGGEQVYTPPSGPPPGKY